MNIDNIIGRLTKDETKQLAAACLSCLGDDDIIQLIREMCLDDGVFCGELVAEIEELQS